MRVTVGFVKRLIREAIEDSDGTSRGGFYDYELPRGVDIHAFWYKSPAREAGQEGDPGRPSDAYAYIGMRGSRDQQDEAEPEGEESVGAVDDNVEDVDVGDEEVEVSSLEKEKVTKRT
jgi:hypothetical protein